MNHQFERQYAQKSCSSSCCCFGSLLRSVRAYGVDACLLHRFRSKFDEGASCSSKQAVTRYSNLIYDWVGRPEPCICRKHHLLRARTSSYSCSYAPTTVAYLCALIASTRTAKQIGFLNDLWSGTTYAPIKTDDVEEQCVCAALLELRASYCVTARMLGTSMSTPGTCTDHSLPWSSWWFRSGIQSVCCGGINDEKFDTSSYMCTMFLIISSVRVVSGQPSSLGS